MSLVYAPFTLRADGLGVVDFGDPMDNVMTTLTDLLGTPSIDRAEESPFHPDEELACHTAFGYPCFDYIRFVTWQDIGLEIVIADWDVHRFGDDYYDRERRQAPPNLRSYWYWGGDSGPTLTTSEGITVGTDATALRDAFGDTIGFIDDECASFDFTVAIDPEGLIGMWGGLEEDPTSPRNVVVSYLGAGATQNWC